MATYFLSKKRKDSTHAMHSHALSLLSKELLLIADVRNPAAGKRVHACTKSSLQGDIDRLGCNEHVLRLQSCKDILVTEKMNFAM